MDEHIINYLASLLDDYKNVVLEEYSNNVYLDCPILIEEDRDAINIAGQNHIYEGQLLLKEIVGRRANGAFDNILLNSWIVRTWGGIRRFNPELVIGGRSRVSLFFEALENRNVPDELMNVIPSLSKIASFIFPNSYFVYDSRVAVALNGLLLRYKEESPDNNVEFFYMPHARNNRDGIMSHIIQNRDPQAIYYNYNEVYFEYCDCIRSLNRRLYNTEEQPGKVEMLLFMLARTGGIIDNWFGRIVNPISFARNYLEPEPQVSPQSQNRTVVSQLEQEESLNELLRSLNEKFPCVSIIRGHRIPGGPKVKLAAELSSEWILAVGAQKKHFFCGLYTKDGNLDNLYPDIFDRKVKAGYYKKFNTYQEALNQFKDILQEESTKFINHLTKAAIETGKVPIMDLLQNSVYYPACGIDGRPIKRFNPLYSEYGINSYVYTDYSIGNELLLQKQDTFKHYHVFAARDLKRTDLYAGSMDFSKFESVLTGEEERAYRETLNRYAENIHVFGKWIVYERDSDAGEEVGAQRFSLLYIGGEGVATYAALYLSNNIAPCILTVIAPGTAFGGNYSCFRDVLSKIVDFGVQLPKYYFSGNLDTAASDCILEKYEKGIIP